GDGGGPAREERAGGRRAGDRRTRAVVAHRRVREVDVLVVIARLARERGDVPGAGDRGRLRVADGHGEGTGAPVAGGVRSGADDRRPSDREEGAGNRRAGHGAAVGSGGGGRVV